MEVEVAEGNRLRLVPLFYLAVFLSPYLALFPRYGFSPVFDPYVAWVFLFTLAQALASAALSVAVGLALLPAFVRIPFVKSVALIPFFAPALSTVDALIRLHGDFMYGAWGIVVAHVVYYAPYAALLMESNLRSIPGDLVDAAELYLRRLWARARFLLGELRPSLLYSFYSVFVFSFLSFTTPLLLGGRYPTLELLAYLYATSFASTGLASGLVLIMLASSAALAVPLLLMRPLPPSEGAARVFNLGVFPTAVSLAATAYFVAVALYIFQPLLHPRGVAEAVPYLLNGVLVAVAASAIALAVSLLFLISDAAGSRTSALAYIASLALSKTLFALGFFHIAQPLYGTLLVLSLAHSLILTPLVYTMVKPAFDKIRQDVREGCLLYFGYARCIFGVFAESLGPTLAQAWIFAVASSLSETTLALILTAGGQTTLSALTARYLTSRGPDLVETGHFYSALLAAAVLLLLAASRLIKTRPYSW